jgi:RNA polymerase sigma factor (sigma-70 family)
MTDDTELLRRYGEDGVEAAFAELVQRHLPLVYTAALRQVNGDAQLAADAAQLVFTDLARKARFLAGHQVLAGWLFTSTRYAASKLVRSEQRRRAREQEAFIMENLEKENAEPELDWGRVRAVLDEAMSDLGRADREAVLLRYFEGRDYASVAARLNLSPNTARMRVERALDKLREQLARRGVRSTSAALAAALAHQSVAAVPAGLAASVTGAALAGGAAAGVGPLAAIFMSATKLQLGVSGALVVAGAAGFVVQANDLGALRADIAALARSSQEIGRLRAENQQLARTVAEVADLRRDDAQLAQLRDEAAALQVRLRAQAEERERVARAVARGPLTGEIFDISKVDRTPAPKFQARPQYPAELRTAGIGGEAVLEFVVDAEGAVRNAKAVRSSHPAFETSAIEAVSKWTFAPGEKGGSKVNTRLQVPIVFTLAEKGKTPPPTLWF